MTTLSPNATELRALCALPTYEALPRAAAFVADLVRDRSFLNGHVLPALEGARDAEKWYVARRWDDTEGSFSIQLFVWPAATRTEIHGHSSWGAYACASGTVFEERYERLDDGSRHEHARIEEVWRLGWGPEDGASTVLPGDGGILNADMVLLPEHPWPCACLLRESSPWRPESSRPPRGSPNNSHCSRRRNLKKVTCNIADDPS